MIMGCYGIGISRVVAAAIEQNNDEAGIIFPPAIAPVTCILLNLDPKNSDVSEKVEQLYDILKKMNMDVLLDDREERPGIKFKDADLIGAPIQLVLGMKGLSKGVIEAKDRRTGEKVELHLESFKQDFETWAANVKRGWQNRV